MDNNEYITISEFAKAVGTTNQAIYQQLDKRLKPYYKVIDNRKMLSSSAIQEIYKKPVDKDFNSNQSSDSQELIKALQTHIQDLQEQLSVVNADKQEKDRQLAEKDKQILDLTETVKTLSQSINAKNHTELADKLETKLLEDGSGKKKGFFSRLFKGGNENGTSAK